MNIIIASGKGGTGKTTFAVNLAYYLAEEQKEVRLLDGDVEEPNDHLFVPSENMSRTEVTVLKPEYSADKCTGCGKCVEMCKYNALAKVKGKIIFFNELCHACGACSWACPEDAMLEKPSFLGEVFYSEKNNERPFYFGYGLLNIGESLAPSVVKELKTHMTTDAEGGETYNILDASPGTACPVVEAMSGEDNISVLVTEPTPFGLNDLKLAVELSLDLGNPTGIIINRSDTGDAIITDFADKNNIPVLGRIPFDRKYAETYSRGEVLIKKHPELKECFSEIFKNICSLSGTNPPTYSPFSYLRAKDNEESFKKGSSKTCQEVVIISGKGGTGKTTVASALAELCPENVSFDADVDAADLNLILKGDLIKQERFSGSDEYFIDYVKCFSCGKCAKNCHFDAVKLAGPANDLVGKTYEIDPLACEGCGLCKAVCPVNAVISKPAHTGDSFLSETDGFGLAHAKLGVGGENSGKLVSHVRSSAGNFAKTHNMPYITGDGPPGTSCPVIASVTGADLIIIVTEPTVSGLHDMQRAMQLVKHFGIKTLIIINKADLNKDMAEKIKSEAKQNNSKVIAEIPFDRNIHDALMQEMSVIRYGKGPAADIAGKLWSIVEKEL